MSEPEEPNNHPILTAEAALSDPGEARTNGGGGTPDESSQPSEDPHEGPPRPPPETPPPLPDPHHDWDRVVTGRAALVVEEAANAGVRSSDSVLSSETSSVDSYTMDDFDAQRRPSNGDVTNGSLSRQRTKRGTKKPRASSIQYMQDASVEVNLLEGSSLELVPDADDDRNGTTADDAQLGSSWSEVFHESHVGTFQSSSSGLTPAPAQPSVRRPSSSISSGSSSQLRRSMSSTSRELGTNVPPRKVFQQYGIISGSIVGGDDDESRGDDEEPRLLYELLVSFATSFRHDLSGLKETIRLSYPNASLPSHSESSLRVSSSPSTNKEARSKADGCLPVIQLLTAGYPSQPALLRCPDQFAGAFVRCVVSVLARGDDSDMNSSSDSSRTAQSIDSRALYASARFQAHQAFRSAPLPQGTDKPALAVVWDLWQRSMVSVHPPNNGSPRGTLSEMLGRLTVVLGVAGVNPRILREMLSVAGGGGSPVDAADRWALIRALKHIAEGASGRTTGPLSLYGEDSGEDDSDPAADTDSAARARARTRTYSGNHDDIVVVGARASSSNSSPLGQAFIPEHFFIWTGRPEGWTRKMSGLTSWPFRNDFAMSLWFRADHLDPSRYPVLLSYRAETAVSGSGGGVHVSLVPLGRGTGTDACTIQVSVYDYDKQVPAQTLHVPGCVLLGNVWYHIAVRHSNARLKGVFSLSSRQQVTVFVNGNVVLQQPLVFPKISASETIQGDSALLPAMVRAAAAAAAARRPSGAGGGGMYSCVWTLCSDFEGQTTSFMVFNDHVSDATFRALYHATGGSDPSYLGGGGAVKLSRTVSGDRDRWDSRKSDIVKKTRVLDVHLMSDDADEVVLSQRRTTILARQRRNAAVMDVGSTGTGATESDDPSNSSYHSQLGDNLNPNGDLLKPAVFGLKVFLVWDPRRAVEDLAIEVHHGAHLNLCHDAFRWSLSSPQDVIGSLGGVQALVLLFRSLLEDDSGSVNGLSYLLSQLSSFVRNHDDNARELLRCGGVDVIEHVIFKAGSKLLKPIHTRRNPACTLVSALVRLRSACGHYMGLETKVFSRLVVNLPLWLGTIYGDELQSQLLPILSTMTKSNPDKVRDCVGVREIVQVLLSHQPNDSCGSSDSLFVLNSDILLGMIFVILSSGVTPQDFSPLLCGLAFNLESLASATSTAWQCILATKLSAVLLFLLQVRPPIAGLYESFAVCCGSTQGAVGWMLCSMVKSSDDQIRSIGVRCVAEYLEVTSKGADSPLTLGSHSVLNSDPVDTGASGEIQSSVARFGRLAKGFVVLAPTIKAVSLTPSKQTPRVVVKLLWHLLKSQREDLGERTNSALIYWIGDDGGTVSATLSLIDFVQNHFLTKTSAMQPGWKLDIDWAVSVLTESGSIVGRSLRGSLVLSAIIRLLKYLNVDAQDRWLRDLFTLAQSNRKSMNLLSSLSDWQPCLFHLVSETLESLRITALKHPEGELEASKESMSSTPAMSLEAVGRRLELCLDLYASLLGHLVRDGGDKSLDAVEQAVSLQRVCLNGPDVVFLVLSGLCENLFDYGTIPDRDIGAISAQDWKDVDIDNDSLPLKQSARLVTDAILSNGAKGLDMPSAVRSWRSLRHLTAVVVALCSSSRFGVVDLFDYNHHQATSIDLVSGGLLGVRLPDGRVPRISHSLYLRFVDAAESDGSGHDDSGFRRDINRRFCTHLSSQILALLDAFIFPESLDEALPSSQLHSLALVRHSEPRLGESQGPLVASALRLSAVLIALLEPGSVKLLQCASRTRCLVSWALEMNREGVASESKTKATESSEDMLNRLFIATLMHCHRALGRCSSLLSEIDSASFEKYFDSRESHKKHHRRLLRTALELRDVVLSIFRGCADLLVLSLSSEAFDALRSSLEGSQEHRISKESVAKEFLTSYWVTGFTDVEIRRDVAIPEQLSMGNVPLRSDQDSCSGGFSHIEKLGLETKSIAADLNKTLDGCFENYLETTRLWAETDAVRDLEFEGDSTVKRLAEKYKNEYGEVARSLVQRRGAAESRLRKIVRMAAEPWESIDHWTLATYTDRNGRRTLLVPNRRFTDHKNASYELMMEKEREKAEKERRARLRENQMTEVMRRNAEAFALHDSFVTDDIDVKDDDSTTQPASDGEASEVGSTSGVDSVDTSKQADGTVDDEWDRIETEEYLHVNAEGDVDAWARLFIWSDGEAVVARFETVIVVTVQSSVEGKLLLTTHGLYLHQTGLETSVITKLPVEAHDSTGTDSKHRRWRLARLIEIHGRRYLLRHQALELFFSDGQQLFINFPGGPRDRDRFHAKLRNSCKVPMLGSLKSLNPRTIFRKTRFSELWQHRKISNFDYLMALNRMAGRSFNDITQYPVFPWVLADYTSETIDLSDSGVYRDLTKPIGALNADRLAQLLERYRDLELFGFTEAEKFLYGSHYSSPGIVLHYLIRQEPFTTMAIELQSGRFDCPDRLFFDIAGSWNGCLASSSDMKELIPEFFCLPEMFLNTNNLPLGRTQGGRAVENVGLPPWAKGSAHEFVRIHRLALESEFVSQNLHSWIDLVFGFKQRGSEAEAAHNLFHHLSYEGTVDLDKIADEVDRQAAESHIQNFGQTPSQLIMAEPHPCRLPAAECWRPLIYSLTMPRNLRCYTPSKQFGNKGSDLANGAVLKIHVLSETLLVMYADMSVGTYRWYPNSNTNRLRMDKLRPLPRRELSTSRSAIKRGSAIPQHKLEQYGILVGNGSFAVSLGGLAKEELRRKAVLPSSTRLIAGAETTLASAETSGYLVSCGFWDDTIKVHSTETLRLMASESGGHRGPIRCFAEDEGLLVTGGEDSTCRIWVLGHPDMTVALSDGYVQTALGASNDGVQLLSCCHVLWGHDTAVTALGLDSSLDAVASGSQSGKVCIHTIRRGEFIRSFQVPSASDPSRACNVAVQKIAIDSTGNLMIHMHDFGLHTYTVNAARLSSVSAGELLNDMRICSHGEILVTGGMNCQVVIRSVHDLRVLSMLDLTRHGPVRCIGLTPDDLNPTKQFLFVGSDDGMITIIDEDPATVKSASSLF